MNLCLHFRSQWGPQTKPTESAHVLQRNYANEGETKKEKEKKEPYHDAPFPRAPD